MKTVSICASKKYDVVIGSGLINETGERLAAIHDKCTVAVIAGENVFPLYAAKVCRSLEAAGFKTHALEIPAGEQHKTLETYTDILSFLAEKRLGRSDLVLALGGGVTGDMAGFAAASYMRGIDFVQMPTTLLAAVDSSVGGKTGVDLPQGKNLVGEFWQPILVLCDTDTFVTLPKQVLIDGSAEVIKYALLGNSELFDSLCRLSLGLQLEDVIATCVSMKRDIVQEDEFENGARRLLNLGHSFGHAIELCSNYTVSHGSAVAIGTAIITRAACKRGYCGEEVVGSVITLLKKHFLPTETEFSQDELFEAALSDKKIAGGKMHLVVPTAIGSCIDLTIDAEEMRDWLRDGGIE